MGKVPPGTFVSEDGSAAVTGINPVDGPGVFGMNFSSNGGGPGVVGQSGYGFGIEGFATAAAEYPALNVPAPGVFGTSNYGEGVRGESTSPILAGVAGANTGSINSAGGPGVFAKSFYGGGLHAESYSGVFAAVAGFNYSTNDPQVYTGPPALGVGVYGQSMSAGPAGFFTTGEGPGLQPASGMVYSLLTVTVRTVPPYTLSGGKMEMLDCLKVMSQLPSN
jgi:hypothetical protein